jgi:uracil-DNA glycosylase
MVHEFCPGYNSAPFDALVADYPGEDVFPLKDFRVEWGPIFHRGRLDGTAKVLVLGQDPATHETVSRRILVGEAGQRTQGLLAKIGIESSYVMVNAFLYSVFGQGGGSRHERDEDIAKYRNRWLDALLVGTDVTAVITLGTLAATAFSMWTDTQPQAAAGLHHAKLRHPTFPESASASGSTTLAQATADLHENWSAELDGLVAHVTPDVPANPTPYTGTWQPSDLVRIPERDLPAGSPGWWCDLAAWAVRARVPDPQLKRATITVTVPTAARTWPPLG